MLNQFPDGSVGKIKSLHVIFSNFVIREDLFSHKLSGVFNVTQEYWPNDGKLIYRRIC